MISKSYELTVLDPTTGEERISVTIPESAAPLTVVHADDGSPAHACSEDCETEIDWGNADWPSDATVSRAASKLLGRRVNLRFFDGADGRLDEGIYVPRN